MSIVVPYINPDQGGQGAITFYDFNQPRVSILKAQSIVAAQQGAPLVQAALTPTYPSIVQPPVVNLPVKLTPGLPSMTPVEQNPPGTGMSCAMKAELEEANRGGWMCRLGAWVDENKWMAAGLVALTYAVTRGGKK